MPSSSTLLASPVALMDKVLAREFQGESWSTWRTLLRGVFEGLETLSDQERQVIRQLTGRDQLPGSLRELWLIVGRRAGKSRIAALLAVWATCCRSYRLAPGELGVFMVLASDRRQARVVRRYISGLLHAHPALEALIIEETAERILLQGNVCIEIHTASNPSVRGYTVIGVVGDEVAYWDSDADGANPDVEILAAVRAGMASVPEALLIALTSPYARRGAAWLAYEKHFGNEASDRVLVLNAATRTMNPTISETVIAAAYEEDPASAAAEFGGEWRKDVELFLPREALEAVRMHGRLEQPPQAWERYVGFIDPAGGTGTDSFTLAIGHRERHTDRLVLDVIREQRPPFSPEATVEAFAAVLKAYRIGTVQSDRYAGAWPVERFSQHGIHVTPSPRTKSELYLDALPLITSGRAELLDHPVLFAQLAALERRTGRNSRDSVDHPPRKHDDVANVVAGVLAELATRTAGRAPRMIPIINNVLRFDLVDAPQFDPRYLGADGDPILRELSWRAPHLLKRGEGRG